MALNPKTQSSLSRHTFWGVGLRFTGLALQLVTGIFAARVMGAQEFGAYVLAHTIVLLAGGAVHWGQGDLALRVLPKASAKTARRLLWNSVMATATSVTLAVPALWAAELAGARLAPGWVLVGTLLALHGGCLTLAALLSACDRVLWVQVIEAALRPAAMLALIGASALFDLSLDATLLFQCGIAAAGLSFGLMAVCLTITWKRRVPATGSSPLPRISQGFPLLATGWSSLFLSQLDHLVVGLVLGNTALGLYRVASRAAGLVGLVQQVATQVLGPRLSHALAAGKVSAARGLTATSAQAATAGGLGVAAIIMILSSPYLQYLGPDYQQAKHLIPIMTLTQICALPFGSGALVLILTRNESRLLKINCFAAIFGACTTAIAAHLFGLIGVSIALLALLPAHKARLRHVVLKTKGPDPAIEFPSWARTGSGKQRRLGRS
ncbi:lipopolysaccharide biosynthesis protein [Actibacterium pelagium]|uniref:Membrane protein involved in the export of O-antigen and teichoic acid n=1 Tax=Actibacterium pelagium TaxID=2029103 RepID=A0A917EKZ1_9RHOB|nr:lipopolysaccharide biosynthesis protein [Actibacterium pelagium]GGE56968.1 hypothetical protein GCM10011517_25920 [Actibacterium pelagium]